MTPGDVPEVWLAAVGLAPERYATMTAGVRRFDAWIADLLAFGLATLGPDPTAALEPTAATLTDDQLPAVANWLRGWIGRVGVQGDWGERLAGDLAYWHVLNRLWLRAERLDEARFAGLALHYGHRIQGARLATLGSLHTDRWCCTGRLEGSDGALNYRRTYFRGRTPEAQVVIRTYAYGAPLPPAAYAVGEADEFALRLYPGGLPGRAAWPQGDGGAAAPALRVATEPPHAFACWAEQASYQRALCLRQPWRRRFPVAVAGLHVRLHDGLHDGSAGRGPMLVLRDSAGERVCVAAPEGIASPERLGDLLPESCWRLLASFGESPVTVYGEVAHGRVSLWSAWVDGRLLAL